MNVLIPDSWLRDFIKTKATPTEIAEKLSLTSFNVEKLHEAGDGDVIYEIEMTPNRGDAFSVLGIAREVCAALKGSTFQKVQPFKRLNLQKTLGLKIELDSKLCPHFAALILDNVVIKPSPKIIQERLEKSGIRALNNVIDVTNYIMLELGQPMHAFDFDSLATTEALKGTETRKKMVLRESRKGEKITTLDGIKRELPEGSIVIDDGEKIIDLCGIMGGENSAIDKETCRVILFAQIYDPTHIRQTSMKLQCRTEAAQRFEKGLDPEMVLPALFKAAEMLKENAGAEVASELINIREKEFEPRKVSLTIEKLNNYLGIELQPQQVQDYLNSLGFNLTYHKPVYGDMEKLKFEVPSWRNEDIQIEEDLIEEVARLYGYHKLPSLLPAGRPPAAIQEKKFAIERRLKYLLKDLGFTEVYTYSFVKEPQMENALKLRSSLTEDLAYMRTNPIPSLLEVVEQNKARFEEIKVFEMANIYWPQGEDQLPDEKMILTAALYGTDANFVKTKGFVEALLKEINVSEYQFQDIKNASFKTFLTPEKSAFITPTKEGYEERTLGLVGEAKENTWVFSLHTDLPAELSFDIKTYKPIPQFPAVKQDLAFVVEKNILAGDILEVIREAGGGLLTDVEIFDVYKEPGAFGKDKKSVAVHLSFQRLDRSLTEKEATTVREKIEQALTKKFNAQIRKDKEETLQ